MTDAEMNAAPTPLPGLANKTPRGVKIALAVSVAINLAVAGILVGLAWNDGPGGRRDRMVGDLGFGPFDAGFSPEDRDQLRKMIVGRLGDFRSLRQQMQGDIAAIVTALRASPYNPVAVSAAFDAQTLHMSDRLKLGTVVVRDFVMALPDDRRMDFADRLEHSMRFGPGHDAESSSDGGGKAAGVAGGSGN